MRSVCAPVVSNRSLPSARAPGATGCSSASPLGSDACPGTVSERVSKPGLSAFSADVRLFVTRRWTLNRARRRLRPVTVQGVVGLV